MSHLPMNAVTFGLMIPLGRRWKSYSTASTTTVCPALLPPWGGGGGRKKVLTVFDTKDKWTHSIEIKWIGSAVFISVTDKRAFRDFPGNQPNLFCQIGQFQHQYYVPYRLWTVFSFIKGTKLWNEIKIFLKSSDINILEHANISKSHHHFYLFSVTVMESKVLRVKLQP